MKNPFVEKVKEETKAKGNESEKNYKIGCFGLKAGPKTAITCRKARLERALKPSDGINALQTSAHKGHQKDPTKGPKDAIQAPEAFIETIFRIGLGHLSFHGTPEQSTLPASSKAH